MNQVKDMSKSYKEVYVLLSFLGEEYINKIPKRLYKVITDNMDKEYDPKVLTNEYAIDERNVSEEAIGLMAIINLNYFVTDEKQKEELKQFYKVKERELNDRYSVDNIFKNNDIDEQKEDSNIKNQIEETAIAIVQDEKWYKKILNKILGLFRKIKK